MLTRRQFLTVAGTTVVVGCAGKTDTPLAPSLTAETRAKLTIKDPAQFKIIQFTDLHFFSSREPDLGPGKNGTMELMLTIIKQAQPDLVMITGDTWPGNGGGTFASFMMRRAVRRLSRIGMPWAYVWGNHDHLADMNAGHKALTLAKDSLYRGAGTGGNYVIEAVDGSGKCAAELVCLNSTVTGMKPRQRQWLDALPEATVPRLAFFHIPIKQYADVWESGVAGGIMGENPCSEEEDGSSLAHLKKAGVRACFCGHDHVDDYAGIIDGVELVYGRATGFGGYGAGEVPKGGKLITLDCNTGTYSMVSLLPDGTSWTAKPGEQTDLRTEEEKAAGKAAYTPGK